MIRNYYIKDKFNCKVQTKLSKNGDTTNVQIQNLQGNRNTKLVGNINVLEKEKLKNLEIEGRISSRHYRVLLASYVKKERGATNRPYTNQTKRFEVGHCSF